MARRSRSEHLKPEIFALFDKGMKAPEVKKAYPQVAARTLYEWHKVWLNAESKQLRNASGRKESDDRAHLRDLDAPILTVVPFDPSEVRQQSDIALARRTLRDVAGDRRINPAIRVQASLGLMKLAYLRSELPKHIIEESLDADIEQISKDLEERSPSELATEYRGMVNG